MASVKGGGPAWLIVPLALGAVVALAAFLLAPKPAGPLEQPAPEDTYDARNVTFAHTYVFPAGPVLARDANGTATTPNPRVLVLRGGNTTGRDVAADLARIATWDAPQLRYTCVPEANTTWWVGSGVGYANVTSCDPPWCITAFCFQPGAAGPTAGHLPLNATRRFGDGNWTANITVYAFQPNGVLLAGNAPDKDLAAFRLSSEYQALPKAPYYLGDGQPPPGAVRLPSALAPLANDIRAKLTGLPEGGIAVTEVTSGLLYQFAGHLYVTARIDDIVLAP